MNNITLFDAFLHSPKALGVHKKLAAHTRNAHKFVLTDEAAVNVAQAIKSYPEMLIDNGPFAIPPFENTWIEFPSANFNFQFIHKGLDDPTADVKVGFLILGNHVYVATLGYDFNGEGYVEFLPFHYEIHRPMTFEEEQAAMDFFGISRAQLDKFFWGHTFYDESDMNQTYKRSLRLMHSLVIHKEELSRFPEHVVKKAGAELFIGAAGELRNIIGMLLAINQPSKYKYIKNHDHRRKLTSRGNKVFMAHSVIDFNIKRVGVKKILSRNRELMAQRLMRWHQVKGHFCHDFAGRQGTGCDHGGGTLWEEIDHRKWECSKCGGKRWWREYPNGHGSSQVGFVNSIHKVR